MSNQTNNLPALTDEQRRANLERAKEARRARAELRRELKTGRISLAAALDDQRAQRLYVRQLLTSLPGIAQQRAGEIMCRLDIAPGRRVHGLGSRQRERLIDMFDGKGR